ncbi:hypothetical protein TNCV_519041 [Trichonephila clavipes]|nr:hypothetical protein TNCV_519041 [Trichonephila clavipes]
MSVLLTSDYKAKRCLFLAYLVVLNGQVMKSTQELASLSKRPYHASGRTLTPDRLNVQQPIKLPLPHGCLKELVHVKLLKVKRELLTTELVLLNHGQVTRSTPELALPANGRTLSLGRFNVHRSLYTAGLQWRSARTRITPATRS